MDLNNAEWRKARKSGENGGACVELATIHDSVVLRDSQDPGGPKLVVSRRDFGRLTKTLKSH
ncbi:DUF397 domain-containing protein [Actinomadura macra]|uniref:DUF397 domain-containing protein n=1 Tax=Actinomadura macra TaxID=46164 RepID=UPI0009FF33F6|nr:DUF397 domain-containing protein [Actinomadura macra]